MSCCRLVKNATTTFIPGDPGSPGSPGTVGTSRYCASVSTSKCAWVPNPAIVYRRVCTPNPRYPLHSTIPRNCRLVPYVNGKVLTGGVRTQIYVCGTTTKTTCYPGVAGTAGTAGTPATPAQIIISRNLGWNSHSRSITSLEVGTYFQAFIPMGVHGVFFGVDVAGNDGQSIASFPHGLLVDVSGIRAYEEGVVVDVLATSYTNTTDFRIVRNADNTISYFADANTYDSLTATNPGDDLLVYAYLYSSLDGLICASFRAVADNAIVSGGVAAADELMIGSTSFPVMRSIGSETGEYSVGYALLPRLAVYGDATEAYIPVTPDTGYAILPTVVSGGFMQSIEIDSGDASFPALHSLGGDYAYAVGNTMLPAIDSYAIEGSRLDMVMFSDVMLDDSHTQVRDLVLVITSDGVLESAQTLERIVIEEYISTLIAQSQSEMLGEYLMPLSSQLRGISVGNMRVGESAAFESVDRVWVVNTDTGASSQYSNYGFNSYFVRGGYGYGVASDGIYRLDGDKDAGSDISAQVNLGSMLFGQVANKAVPAVYVNASSDGKLVLKVEVDGAAPRYYAARSSSTALDNHRIDPDRGLRGNNWVFTVMNQNGDDFSLAELEFVPIILSRRV